MERNRQLASARPSSVGGPLTLRAALLILMTGCALGASGQTPGPQVREISSLTKQNMLSGSTQQLFAGEHWQEVVQSVESSPQRSPELNYYYGVALAHLGRLDDAHEALLLVGRPQPGDKRFPVEFAPLAFRQKNYPQAAAYLRRALRLDPHDPYANDFLATVYFLQGNDEAALKYWDRIPKPEIPKPETEDIRVEPQPHADPVLLDHAFAFSPPRTLRLHHLLTTRTRLDAL